MAKVKAQTASTIKAILNDPYFPEKVREASPDLLLQWIHDVGLEDAGEIVAFATIQQIEQIFDTDLWRQSKAGADETFDSELFAVWLEVLCEIGFEKAAKKVLEMDEDFLVMAFCEIAWVVDADWLAGCCEDDPHVEKIIESKLTYEIDSFIIFGKKEQAWDNFISLIAALDSENHTFLYRVLGRCSDIFVQDVGDDIFDVFSSEEQLIDDVSYEREKRRESKGFVTPSAARAFLKLCDLDITTEDLLTPKSISKRASLVLPVDHGGKDAVAQIPIGRFSRVKRVFEMYPDSYGLFLEQLGYLSNTLMSGWTWKNEEQRPGRATEIVLEVCEEGLSASNEEFESFVKTFRIGWPHWCQRCP